MFGNNFVKFKIENNTLSNLNGGGIALEEFKYVSILSNNIQNTNLTAIRIGESQKADIGHNTLKNNSDGIEISNSKNSTVYNNYLDRIVNIGISLYDTETSKISNNYFKNCNYGLDLYLDRYSTVLNNTFDGNTVSIAISESHSIDILKNILKNSKYTGISVFDSNNTNIRNNNLYGDLP
nr:right-handed parallel beta-helix repeat-containing protein [Methanobrevibacter filiformis]